MDVSQFSVTSAFTGRKKKQPEVELFSAELRTGANLHGRDTKPLKIGVCKAKGYQKKNMYN